MSRKTPSVPLENEIVLRHWLEAVPNDRLAHLIKDTSRGLVRALQMRLTAHAVSFGHWAFLRVLWERDGLTQRELSQEVGMTEPTTAAALRALEKLGYVVRRKKVDNRKNSYVFLTPKGAALKAKLVPLAEAVNEIAVRDVSPEHIAITRQTLLAMIRNLARDEAETQTGRRMLSTRELARVLSGSPRARKRA
jgi:MarR family transcriptional regulator, organic hydroperoxide resistance regulator